MTGTTVLIITFVVALVLVIGGGLVFYMSNLVKSAYDIKVALNSEIEEKLRRIEDDMEKKSRWIKKELIDEVEKMKVSVQYDSAKRIDEAALNMGRKITEIEEFARRQQIETVKALEETRGAVVTLDQKLNVVRRDQKREDVRQSATVRASVTPAGPAAAAPQEIPDIAAEAAKAASA